MSETAKLALQVSMTGADRAVSGLHGMKAGVNGVRDSLTRANEQLFYFLNNARMIGGALGDTIQSFLDPNIEMDKYKEMFTFLLKDSDRAETKLRELFNVANEKGFPFAEVVDFYTNLYRVSDGALAAADKMDLFLSATKRSGNEAGRVGQLLAEAWFALERGAGIDTVAATMKRLGIITPDTVNAIRKLQEEGASSSQMWGLVEDSIKQTTSAVAGAETTWSDITNKIENYRLISRQLIGEKLFESLKDDLGELGGALDKVFASGRLEKWAGGLSKEMAKIYESLKDVSFSGLNINDIFAALDSGHFIELMTDIGKTAALNFWEVMKWGAQQYGPSIQRALIPKRMHWALGLSGESDAVPFPAMHTVDNRLLMKLRFGDVLGDVLESASPVSRQLSGAGFAISGMRFVGPGGETRTAFSVDEGKQYLERLSQTADKSDEAAQHLRNAAQYLEQVAKRNAMF